MLFNRAKSMESNIDSYLDNIITSGLIFKHGIKHYFEGNNDSFEGKVLEIKKLETECDRIKRDVKHTMYKDLLIPESRGDVLRLLENLDDIIGTAQKVLVGLSIESPKIWPQLKDDFIELSEYSATSVKEIAAASRAFFRDPNAVSDYLVSVHFLEGEADKVEERILRKSFEDGFIKDFSQKIHMRYFAERISKVADDAENVADMLEIFTIKRTI